MSELVSGSREAVADHEGARALVRAGQAAARAGDRLAAYGLFVRATAVESTNVEAWLWRAGTAAEADDAVACLERALRLDPGNERARRGLEYLRQQYVTMPRAPRASARRTARAAERPARRRAGRRLCAALGLFLVLALWQAPVARVISPAEALDEVLTARALEQTAPPAARILLVDATVSVLPAPPETTSGPALVLAPEAAVDGSAPAVTASRGDRAEPEVVAMTGRDDWMHPDVVASAVPESGASAAEPPLPGERAGVRGLAEALAAPGLADAVSLSRGSTLGDSLFLARLETGETPKPAGDTKPAAEPGPATAGGVLPPAPGKPGENGWVGVHRLTGLWSGPDGNARMFRTAQPGERFQVARPQSGPRLYVLDPTTKNYAYVDALDVGPIGPPSSSPSLVPPGKVKAPAPPGNLPWVAVHHQTGLWSGLGGGAELFRMALPGEHFQVARLQDGPRLYVWDPTTKNYAFITAVDVGPAKKPDPKAKAIIPPAPGPIPQPAPFWTGVARVTMYTCVELGGCNRTAMGIWPYEGVVAVDRRLIPLGSTVWLEGLGTFLAADTGGAIYGNRIDVFVNDYHRAIQWGVRYLNAAAYPAR